jgi:hypothetical protein
MSQPKTRRAPELRRASGRRGSVAQSSLAHTYEKDGVCLTFQVLKHAIDTLRVRLDARVDGSPVAHAVLDLLNQKDCYGFIQSAKERAPSVEWSIVLIEAKADLIGVLEAHVPSQNQEDGGFTTYLSPWEVTSAGPHEIRGKRLTTSTTSTTLPWPKIAREAFYGLAGDYVRAIEPHSESDPAALLIQFHTAFGVVAGRNKYFPIEATRHYANIDAVVAGLTSRARKGTSYAHIEAQMQAADPTWTLENHIKGCGSGEGLIYAVRDKRMGKEPVKEKGRIVGYQEVELDPGVEDKRGLYQTGEFSSILKVAAREGNTLSEVIRDIWDTGYLRNTTKGHPLTATDAHIGIIGHITIAEVQKLLTSTDMANGFANRFIWICAKRSKELPEGGNIESVDFAPLLKRLCAAVTFSKGAGRMQRDAQAKAAWNAVYGMLSEDRTGLANTILARAEAQVLRLSMLYALLDCTATIRLEHLNAALALWQYAEDSAAYIFGQATGDDTADTLLNALEKAGKAGLTKNYIVQEVFHRNVKASEVARVLNVLEKQGRITSAQCPPEGGKGRHSEVYALTPYVVDVVDVVNQSKYLSATNDAAKAIGISTENPRGKYVVSPQDDDAESF